jgi:serine/threonine-protein kinase HipA
MNVKALGIFLGGKDAAQRIGVLFQYQLSADTVTTRFVADEPFAADPQARLLSTGLKAADPHSQRALWAQVTSRLLNGRFSTRNGWMLPAFFQNLLPEGVFRDHIAQLRGCDPKDHFEMLAACGKDLPGFVYALPVELDRDELAQYITQGQDALEMSVTAQPLDEGVSLSGVQPKLAVSVQDGRYVARTKTGEAHVIAKLPVVGQPRLPELEHLSLMLARAAGARVCEADLVPLSALMVDHGYDLGDADARTMFLAVRRYDRDAPGRVHCEDFAQVLGVWPEDKYTGSNYTEVAQVLLALFGEEGVAELLRRLLINELLGNSDMHLKNIGLRYPDGRTPELPGAYDIVAYAAYGRRMGHAMSLLPQARGAKPQVKADPAAPPPGHAQLSPAVLRQLCTTLRIPERPMAAVLRRVIAAAIANWPAMIAASALTESMKSHLLAQFNSHRMVQSYAKRRASAHTE